MIRSIQNSFVSGEIAPGLSGRNDLKAYFNGAAKIKNYIVRKTGGVRKRAGCDILLDLSAYSGGRILPFFYDDYRGYLLVLHNGYGRVIKDGSMVQSSSGGDYTFAVPWTNAQLQNIRYQQYGDTLTCAMDEVAAQEIMHYAADDWRVTPVRGVTSVVPPSRLLASATGFSGGTAISQEYALYAKRGGVLSEAVRKRITIQSPWNAGATVSLSFTPDMRTADSYIIAKKGGAYFGVLAECYEEKEVIDSGLTFSTSPAHSDSAYLFSTSPAADVAGEVPNAKENIEVKQRPNKNGFHIPPADGVSTLVFTLTSAKKITRLRIYLGGYFASVDKQRQVVVDYSAAQLLCNLGGEVSGSGGAISGIATDEFISCGPQNYVDIDYTGTDIFSKLFLQIEPPAGESGIVVRGFKVYTTANTWVAGSWDFSDSTKAFSAAAVAGTVEMCQRTTKAYANLADSDTGNEAYETSCIPKKYLYLDKYPVGLTPQVQASGGYMATVSIRSSSVISAVELRVYPGASVKRYPDRVNDGSTDFPSNIKYILLFYSYDGSTWYQLPESYRCSNEYTAAPIVIKIPVDKGTGQPVVTSAYAWSVGLVAVDPDQPIVIRGVQVIGTTVQSSFTDINHTPSELITGQTFIEPGSARAAMAVRAVGFYQQRMIYGGSADSPFSLWFSAAGSPDLWYASRPMVDSDPFRVTIPAARASAIKHIVSARRFMVFTEGGVYVVDGSTEGFSYRTIEIKEVSSLGCGDVPPVILSNSVLYVGAGGREVFQLQYDITEDGMLPLERIVLAEHLTEGAGIVAMVYQRAPEGVAWCLLSDGRLLSFTCLPEHEVYAWAQHELSGVDKVLDLVGTGVLSDPGDGIKAENEIYALCAVGTKEILVQLRPSIATATPLVEQALTLDLMQRISTESAADELEPAVAYDSGEQLVAVELLGGSVRQVTADADGKLSGGGAFPAGNWAVGYPVAARLDMLRPELPDRNIQGLQKNVIEALVRCCRSGGPQITASNQRRPVGGSAPVVQDGRFIFAESADFKTLPCGLVNSDGWLSMESNGVHPSEILCVVTTLELEGS